MKRHPPSPYMEIPVSQKIYGKLCTASLLTGYVQEDWEIAEIAIHEWLVRHAPDALDPHGTSGYQWKDVFLPSGTLLRTVFEGKNHHCLVEGDRLLYDGKPTSPNCFVKAVGGVRRSAWRSIWVLMHGSATWSKADDLRRLHATRRKCL